MQRFYTAGLLLVVNYIKMKYPMIRLGNEHELMRAVNIQGNELTHLKHKSNQTTAHVTSRSALQYCQPDPHGELYQDEAPDD